MTDVSPLPRSVTGLGRENAPWLSHLRPQGRPLSGFYSALCGLSLELYGFIMDIITQIWILVEMMRTGKLRWVMGDFEYVEAPMTSLPSLFPCDDFEESCQLTFTYHYMQPNMQKHWLANYAQYIQPIKNAVQYSKAQYNRVPAAGLQFLA